MENIIKLFEEYYLPKVEESIRKVMRIVITTKNKTAGEKLGELMGLLDKKGDNTIIASFKELVKIGAGFHRQTSTIVDNFIYDNLLS